MTRNGYTLYYWPIPFRGHFIRYVLAHAGAAWDEPGIDALSALKSRPVADQPLPHMAPPVLQDRTTDIWLSQLPAILMYLGKRHGLLAGDVAQDTLTLKVICDCNDVLEEITCNCGRTMWTKSAWDSFTADRLPRWMQIFEETGHRHGLSAQGGYMLGTPAPTLADMAVAALWFTMTDKLAQLAPLLETHAPDVAGLSRRIAGLPAIAAMRRQQDAATGDIYCGGQIEASLRAVVGA